MKLDEFVSQSLLDIVKGVKDAQEKAAKDGAIIYPAKPYSGDLRVSGSIPTIGSTNPAGKTETSRAVSGVEFDLVVTIEKSGKTEAAVVVLLAAITSGAKQTIERSTAHENRIRFTIPVAFPVLSNQDEVKTQSS